MQITLLYHETWYTFWYIKCTYSPLFLNKSDRVYNTIDKTKLPFTSTYNMYQVKTILSEYQQPLKAALVLLFSRFCIKSIVIECMFINNVVK